MSRTFRFVQLSYTVMKMQWLRRYGWVGQAERRDIRYLKAKAYELVILDK
jgi:hypothetical protein